MKIGVVESLYDSFLDEITAGPKQGYDGGWMPAVEDTYIKYGTVQPETATVPVIEYDPGFYNAPAVETPIATQVYEPPIQTTKVNEPSIVIEGWIYDKKTRKSIPATIQMVVNATGQAITDPYFVDNGSYSAWTEQSNRYENAILFSAPGYVSQKIQFNTLENNPDVFLSTGDEDAFPWLTILVIAAVYAYMKKSNKVGALSTGDLIPIFLLAGGVVGFSFVEKILQKLGLWNSKDSKDLDNAQNDPNSFWSPTYWKTALPPGKQYSYAISTATAQDWSNDIYNSFGAFNDNEEQAIGIMKQCRTKANASFLAYIFQQQHGVDLLTFLRGGNWPQDRLSDADVNVINQYISQLPAY